MQALEVRGADVGDHADVRARDLGALRPGLSLDNIGAPTDTSRDYVLTDWSKLDRFVRDRDEAAFAALVKRHGGMVRKETSNCMPPGMPNMMATGQYPIEFLFTPGRVTMHHEAWMQLRSIYTDGRGHPDDWELGIFGHSIGHWEGQTLVVETIGIKTITELGPGIKHSDKLKITERIGLSPTELAEVVGELGEIADVHEPVAELEETKLKAKALLAALNAADPWA